MKQEAAANVLGKASLIQRQKTAANTAAEFLIKQAATEKQKAATKIARRSWVNKQLLRNRRSPQKPPRRSWVNKQQLRNRRSPQKPPRRSWVSVLPRMSKKKRWHQATRPVAGSDASPSLEQCVVMVDSATWHQLEAYSEHLRGVIVAPFFLCMRRPVVVP